MNNRMAAYKLQTTLISHLDKNQQAYSNHFATTYNKIVLKVPDLIANL